MKNKLAALKLDHDSYISLHVQLLNQLRQLIVSGRWQPGDRIPSEPQLARHLEISRTTVRIALQNAELEGLIKRAAGRGTFVSYQREFNGNTRLIGYVTRSFHTDIHRVLLSSAETELRSAGYRVVFSNATDHDEEVAVLERLLDDQIAGLLLWPNANATAAQQDILQHYQALGIPIVFIDRYVNGIAADFVASDNFGGTTALLEHLVALGHRHIVYLRSNIKNLFPVEERQRAYEAVARAHHLTRYEVWRINSPQQTEFIETDIYQLFDEESAALAGQMVALLERTAPRPTAIACVNDALAIITVRAIQQMGLSVPDDVSVVGFDDISLAAYMGVPLTTVAQDAHAIGQVAAQMLLDRLSGSATGDPRQRVVPTRLQVRQSTAVPGPVNQATADA